MITSTMEHDVTTPTDLDVEKVRGDFPALHQSIDDMPLVYLDNAATTQKPRAVIEAVRDFYSSGCGNVRRGLHALSQRTTEAYESARMTVKRHLGAARSEEIVFVRGATEAINLVAASFVRPRLGPGSEVLVTAMEHHSNIVPWQLLCADREARLRAIPIDDRGEIMLGQLERMLSERTRLLGISHVSNALGTVNPVQEVVAMAHQRGIPVLIDGAQAVPHMKVDVTELDCDFYVLSGHKTYGPAGIGALYAKLDHLDTMPPYQGGGEMIRTVSFGGTTYAAPPHRFEAGTPNMEGAIGLAAALDYLDGLGLEAIERYEQRLVADAATALSSRPGVRLVGTPQRRAGVISFVVDGAHPHDVGTILDQQGVAVRAGHHCAQPVMDRFGVPATVRASFGLYNTRDEVDLLLGALDKVLEVFA
jgi:cysteine desulfurase/selenocysteine lyase